MESLYQTESFVTACISLVRTQTNRDGVNSRRVRTHEKKSGMLFADWAQYYKAFFVPSQEPASLCTDVPPPLGKIGRGDVCESPKIIVFPFPRNVGDSL